MKQNLIQMTLAFFFVFISMSIKSQSLNDSIVLSIAGIREGDVSKDAIIKNPFIKCSYKDMEIVEFSLSYDNLTGNHVKYDEKGNKLSTIMIKEIQALDSEEQIILTANVVNKKNGQSYNLWAFLRIINSKPEIIEQDLNE